MKEIKLLYPPVGPNVFRRMLDKIPKGNPGEIFKVIDKRDNPFGYAFFNPNSSIVFRIFSRDIDEELDIDKFIEKKIAQAVDLRKELGLPCENTNAYRLIHDYGDGLPGLVADVYGENIVVELYSIGFYLLRREIEKAFLKLMPSYKVFFRASDYTMKMEGFEIKEQIRQFKTKIKENGIIFEVEPLGGYKTGFFCDQRENRKYLAELAKDKTVIDICCYSGGFGIYAKKSGGAKEVTSVDLDAEAIELLKRNANLNSIKINSVCADAFIYMRQMIELKRKYDIVIIDPSKLITSRENKEEGIVKYKDLNKLAIHLVKEGGILVSCSCSGLLSWEDFLEVIRYSASVARKKLQIFKKSGASPDHPFMINYREGEYLKVVWSRIT